MYHAKEAIDTADITCKDLQAARETAGLYQHQVARQLHVSEDTVSRWERGEAMPTSEQVDKMEKLYKAPGLWYGWMRYHDKPFRDRFPEEPKDAGLALTMLQARYQVADLLGKQEAAIRDAIDGKIDDRSGYEAYIREVKEAHSALGKVLAMNEMDGG